MSLRQIGGQVSIKLMRTSKTFKIFLTCIWSFSIVLVWWFGLQRRLLVLKKETAFQISQLAERKNILDEVLLQYQALNKKLSPYNFQDETVLDQVGYCKTIVDQAGLANLSLQSYNSKKLKNGQKQMVFLFGGDYQQLLTFLHNLNQVELDANCNKLRVTDTGYRLQIAYVCGIHTSVK